MHAVSATNRDIQAAEQRLPSIGNSCTVTTLLTTTASDNVSTKSMPTAFESTIRDGNNQQTTTLPVVSDGISGSPVKEESSGDDGQFLSLSLLEFILVVVIAAVVVIAVFVVISVACCWCLHMKRVQMANKNCEGN